MEKLILNALLSKGYFPRELPPTFTTYNFGIHAEDILKEWEAKKIFSIKPANKFKKTESRKVRRGVYGYNLKPAEPEIISKPKKLYERRNIHITHPIPQALLSREIAENWRTIQKWLSLRKFSEDEIIVSDRFPRSIKGINFPIHRAKKSYLEATADWLVKTDISRFYPSIYTHSIAWAAYGKERVKTNLDTYTGTLADRLDLLVRACNRNQTVGIPIGPETSRILAETISSRIDHDFTSLAGELPSQTVDRLQDDWCIGARSHEQAEQLLSIISQCYREYGLEINGSKTSINHILASHGEDWKSEITAFLSHRKGDLFGTRLEEFLSMCLRLQIEFPNNPVLNYALAIVENQKFSPRCTEVLESFLLKAAVISPISMDRICRIILNIDFQRGGLSKERLVRRFTELAERHFENDGLFEVIWLVYTIRGLKKPLVSKKIMNCAENIQSSAIRLLLLDMHNKGFCGISPPVQKWEDELDYDRTITDWSWLLGYEGIRNGWLKDRNGLMSKPFFKSLSDRNVSFYDPAKNIQKSKSVKRAGAKLRQQQYKEVLRFLEAARGVEFNYASDDYI